MLLIVLLVYCLSFLLRQPEKGRSYITVLIIDHPRLDRMWQNGVFADSTNLKSIFSFFKHRTMPNWCHLPILSRLPFSPNCQKTQISNGHPKFYFGKFFSAIYDQANCRPGPPSRQSGYQIPARNHCWCMSGLAVLCFDESAFCIFRQIATRFFCFRIKSVQILCLEPNSWDFVWSLDSGWILVEGIQQPLVTGQNFFTGKGNKRKLFLPDSHPSWPEVICIALQSIA